ncbi:MAG: tRNA (adenosine(37)-N6)-threonylcarbamoyltransferase complex dimerization subunit type 1 TsaB [Aquimonas sp.]|nr:tRNA (adenosine(37)-N6)-threonylcarbamoyltransferase complex dimerization subunit type 1 TsaB [Aquimonas sp.]
MNLLAIETATEACSVALLKDGAVLERFEIAPRRHAELVLPWCEELLAEAGLSRRELDAIAVGIGPGAFTGVRLAVAMGHGLALALDRPLIGISSLQVLAAGARGAQPGDGVFACIDARMGEVYAGAFRVRRDGLPEPVGDPQLAAPADTRLPDDHYGWARGSGLAAGQGEVGQRLQSQGWRLEVGALPAAADLARLAARAYARGEYPELPEGVQPLYLRDKVALTIAERAVL